MGDDKKTCIDMNEIAVSSTGKIKGGRAEKQCIGFWDKSDEWFLAMWITSFTYHMCLIYVFSRLCCKGPENIFDDLKKMRMA